MSLETSVERIAHAVAPLEVRHASFTDEEMRRVSPEARGPQPWLVLRPLATPAAGV